MTRKTFFNLTGIFLVFAAIIFLYITSAATPLTIETISSDNKYLESN
ncbi:MAG: hypothetical protein L3J59_11740 [Methylococcaceae bacterium]|nr:hypothetical protein [Methylococcaceae bacterium]